MRKDAHVKAYMKRECADSGQCIMLGKQFERIYKYFDMFDLTSGLVTECQRFGAADSVNGVVRQVTFSKEGYESSALVKGTQYADADNLVYEYAAGMFLNEYCDKLPCFVQTYGIYIFTNVVFKRMFSNDMPASEFPNAFRLYEDPFDLRKQCTDSSKMAVVTHFLKGSISMNSFLKGTDVSMNVFGILFQIYFCLDVLGGKFTHYDLHTENVLLYKFPGPVLFRYETSDGVIEFRCWYLAKIIDYGRSYFNGAGISSKEFAIRADESGCHGVGFKTVERDMNMSQNLRLMSMTLKKLKTRNLLPRIVDYYTPRVVFDGPYSTPEVTRCPGKICTVRQLMHHFYSRPDDILRDFAGHSFAYIEVNGVDPIKYERNPHFLPGPQLRPMLRRFASKPIPASQRTPVGPAPAPAPAPEPAPATARTVVEVSSGRTITEPRRARKVSSGRTVTEPRRRTRRGANQRTVNPRIL